MHYDSTKPQIVSLRLIGRRYALQRIFIADIG